MSARTAALLVALLASLSSAEEGQGYAELRAALFPGAAGDKLQLVEHVRPSFQTQLAERVKLVATVEAGLAEGRDTATVLDRMLRASELGPLYEAAECAPVPRANSFLHIDGAEDYLDVDRLFVDVYNPSFDLRIGRQAVNWGSARFLNPTDPFPQVLLTEPWRPRRGVNALRLTVPFTQASDATAVVATDDAFTGVRAAGRARVNWMGTDFAAVGGYRGEGSTAFAGLDLRGTAVVGFWLEAAWVFSKSPHEEVAVGIDYSFPVLEQMVAFAQYSRNGSGLTSPDQYPSAATRLAGPSPIACSGNGLFAASATSKADPFAPFTVGRDYGLVGLSLGLLTELSASATALLNLDDGTAIFIPALSWAARDWLDVSASASVPAALWGHGGEFKPRAKDLRVTFPAPGGGLSADFSGLVPAATLTLWTRASF